MRIGVSIFTGLKEYNLENNLQYLKSASEHGCELMFTSAHINEADNSIEELNTIIEKAAEYNIKVVIDVSKKAYENLKFSDKVFCYRLDYGFTKEEIVKMSQNANFYIELNASTLSEDTLKEYIYMGLNTNKVRASFNYYPKLYTAHSFLDVVEKTKMFSKYGIKVGAFLPSFYGKRPPMYEGLPSIETHRNQDLAISIEELKAAGVSEIFFGDAYADISELILLEKHNSDDIVLDTKILNKFESLQEFLENTLRVRPDYNDYLLRFGKVNNLEILKKECKESRRKFDLTVDNNLFKRYCGEVNLVLQDLPYDERVNVVGKVKCSDYIINKIKETKKVKLNVIE